MTAAEYIISDTRKLRHARMWLLGIVLSTYDDLGEDGGLS